MVASSTGVGTTSQNIFSNAGSANSAQKQQIDFLAMLMVQLKNQNPSQPYDNQQFAAQLATFSQLEQLTDIRTLLEDQADIIALMAMSMENTALPGMIGKYATAASGTLDFDGINPTEIGFKTPYPVASGKVKITDSSGKIVRMIDLDTGDCMTGEHKINWDGCDDAGNRLLPGKYKVSVDLTERDGDNSIKAETFTVGKIEAVKFKKDGTVLVINGTEVPLGAVNDVRESAY
jgi:flagellar basal-body rod modification protein FlgD